MCMDAVVKTPPLIAYLERPLIVLLMVKGCANSQIVHIFAFSF